MAWFSKFTKTLGEVTGIALGAAIGTVGGIVEAAKELNNGGDWEDARDSFTKTFEEILDDGIKDCGGAGEQVGEFLEENGPAIAKGAVVIIGAIGLAAAQTKAIDGIESGLGLKQKPELYPEMDFDDLKNGGDGIKKSYSQRTGISFTSHVFNKFNQK